MLQHVSWSFEAKDLDNEAFKSKIYEHFDDIFTVREIEVIRLIKEGLTNKLIAEKLYLSIHTIAAHRKSIFKKSDSHNSGQLISFCMERGIG
jgi:DNA-binding NarL/FixJ family response regulator